MSDGTNHNTKPPGIRRRGFVLGFFAAAAAPKTVFVGAESLGSIIEAATTKAAAIEAPVADGAALNTLIRQFFVRESHLLSTKRVLIQARIVFESCTPETAAEAAELARVTSEINFPPIANTVASLFRQRQPKGLIPPEMLTSQQRYKGIVDQLLAKKPNAAELQTSFQTLQQNDPEIYRLYFGDATTEEAAQHFSQAIADGKPGMRALNQRFRQYEKAILENELQESLAELSLRKLPTFTNMSAARKAGGYPVTKEHIFVTNPAKVAYLEHSGEWSKRIAPADENAPFPLSR
jgi:hypothetical protein